MDLLTEKGEQRKQFVTPRMLVGVLCGTGCRILCTVVD